MNQFQVVTEGRHNRVWNLNAVSWISFQTQMVMTATSQND
jgi:hypothetical protein